MNKQNIYVTQFATGAPINLLPLSAGQLVSRLKVEPEIVNAYNINEIICRRENPRNLVSRLGNVSIAGLSCFLWNANHSLAVAKEIKKQNPESLIVIGGPSIPKDSESSIKFLKRNNYIDVICIDEGEDIFVGLCKAKLNEKSLGQIPGIIYQDKKNRVVARNKLEQCADMSALPSPYLDGTFDELYRKLAGDFSGAVLETNRGCPYKCSYCTWGNQPFHQIREKSIEIVRKEIEWLGKNRIEYVAMCDANFGIRDRDVEVSKELARCKEKYGYPSFIGVSWAKNSSKKVLEIADILKSKDIGFRITLSLQSLNPKVIKEIRRVNIKREEFNKIKEAYRKQNHYSYTELILGLPEETYKSFITGVENSLSNSLFDQLYIYPLFLFPNTEMSLGECRKKHLIETKKIECTYTKSKTFNEIKEEVEIVIGNRTMPKDKWVDAFVMGYETLALHDDRLGFFIMNYLKREFGIKITDFVSFARDYSKVENLLVIKDSFSRLENCALDIQNKNKDHLIRPKTYSGIPFDPPEGIFLELLINKESFYKECLQIAKAYLKSKEIGYDNSKLEDLFKFQEAVISHPNGPRQEHVDLNYDWIGYFSNSFHLPEKGLDYRPQRLKIIDTKPSNGDLEAYLKNHFDIRGVPPFNFLENLEGKRVFPPIKIQGLE